MKRIKGLLIILLFIPFVINASCINSDGSGKRGSVSLSASNLNVYVGKSTTFKISAPCAAGKVKVSSSDTSIATVNKGLEFLDNESLTVTVKGKKVGKVTISVALEDIADYASNVLTGTKTLVVNVKEQAKSTPSTSTTTTTTPTTPVVKEMKINSFEIIGYPINFNIDTTNYTIEVDPDVKKIYIKISGENYTAIGDKDVSIDGKDSIVVTLKNGDKVLNYTININRKTPVATTEIKEVVKEVYVNNNTYLYTTIGLLALCVVFLVILLKKKGNSPIVEQPIVKSTYEEKKLTPIETTHINNAVYTTPTVTNPNVVSQPVNNGVINPLDNMNITPQNNIDNNLN